MSRVRMRLSAETLAQVKWQIGDPIPGITCGACGGPVIKSYGRLVCEGDCQNDDVPAFRWDEDYS